MSRCSGRAIPGPTPTEASVIGVNFSAGNASVYGKYDRTRDGGSLRISVVEGSSREERLMVAEIVRQFAAELEK